MTQSMVQSDGVTAATVKFNNGNDESRTYDVSSLVDITDGSVTAIKDGMVRTLGDSPVSVANFARWSQGHLTVNYDGVTDADDMASMLSAITSFTKGVEASAATNAQASL